MIGNRANMVNHGGCHPRELQRLLNKEISFINPTIKSTKRVSVILWIYLATKSGYKVTRFDAEWIGDHCLNTTISEIQQKNGVPVQRRDTKRPTRFGKPTSCKEYWLDDDAMQKVEQMLFDNILGGGQ